MDAPTNAMQERRARIEQLRKTRRSMLRWRWVMVALGAALAAALLANGSLVIGGLLAALVGVRIVLLARMQRLANGRSVRAWPSRSAEW